MQQTFLRIENTINQATGNTAAFNGKMQQATNIIKKLRGEVSTLRSEIDKLNQKLKGTNGPLDKQRTLWERLTQALQKNQYFASLAISALVGFVNQRLIGGIIKITDEYTLMENKIKTAIPSVDRLSGAMESVYRIAQETRQPLEIVGNMYSRIGRNSKELRKDLSALNDVVSTVSKAFQIGGATIEESRNAMVQFSQALASGRLQGDELRSILELAPVLATSISKSIGITTGSLRRLASEGLITTEVLIKALLEAGKDIRTEFAKFTPTVSQSAETVINSFKQIIGSNERFKLANKALGNQLRQFSLALEEQGVIANALGDLYLKLAENVDKLAAAFVALGTVLAGAGILALLTFLTTPIGAISGIVAAVISLATYFGMVEASAEKTAQQMNAIKKMAGADYDFSGMSDKEKEKTQQELMKNQAVLQTLITQQENEVAKLNLEIEGYREKLEEIYASGKGVNALELAQNEVSIALAKKNVNEKLAELERYRDRFEEIQKELVQIEENAAMEAMLARTKALEAQKRSLKQQATSEQMSYLTAYGSGMSDKGLSNIKFANKEAQNLRKSISDITMKLTDRAFMGSLSVNSLFGGTDPSKAVSKLSTLIGELESVSTEDTGKGLISFFSDLFEGGGPQAENAIKEIAKKLEEEPFTAKLLKENMVTVWKEALENYKIYAAEVEANEERYMNIKIRDFTNEAYAARMKNQAIKDSQAELLQGEFDLHNRYLSDLKVANVERRAALAIEMHNMDLSAERREEIFKELGYLEQMERVLAQREQREKGINQVLQNRENFQLGKEEGRAISREGTSQYGGSVGMDFIGSSVRDANIEYQKTIQFVNRIYENEKDILAILEIQAANLRDQNVARAVNEKLLALSLEAEQQNSINDALFLQTKLQEKGKTDTEIKIALINQEAISVYKSIKAQEESGKLSQGQAKSLIDANNSLTKQKILYEQISEQQANLEATRSERAVGGAVIEGAQALFDGEFYKNIYNSLVTGGNYLLDGIKQIEWSDLGTQIGDGLKNIDWDNLGDLFKGGMGDLAGSGLFQGIASAGGASGQRALNIAQAGAAGGPVAALGAAILSNEKVQAALSKLFDAVFKFIDPFLDLLGPVIDIFTAFLENNPIMTAINALKPLLEGLSNALSALSAAIKNLDLSGDNIFTNIPVIGPAIKYMADGSMAKDFENAFDKTFLSGFGGRGGVLEVRIPALEDIMGKFYTDFAASGVMAGKKDFRTIYDETTKAFEGATKTYTEEVPDTYINYQYLTGNIIQGFKWVTKQVALTWKTVERTVPMTSAEIAAKAEEAVRKTFEKILEGIDEETKSIIAETEKLNQENKTSLEAGVDTIKGVREVMQELEFGLTFLSSDKAEEARKQMEAFSKAQEEYFEALVGSEIRQATEDLEDSILRIDRISTNLSEHAAKGLGAFEKQVDDFAKAIRLVSDPDKKKQLIENLNAFVSAFAKVSEATANEQIQDISLRGYDLTSEQELTVKYHKEMQDVLAQENLTIQDKKRVLLELNDAREREVAAMEREQELLNLRGAQSALAEILSTFEKTIEGINDLIQSLYDQVQDLLFGEFNLDPYLQKFELASDTYGTLLEAAFDPDATEDDIKKLQEFVNTYLGTARDLYKSSSTFQQIFSNVLSDLSVLGVQTGFNMPTAAVGTATSEIQEFIDATEDLSEDLSETLNDLIFDLNDLGMAFAQQRIDLIQDGLNIPLKITNNMIVVDLGDVNQTLTLTNENFTLDLTKLDLAASFEEITFTPNFGEVTDDTGWQDYEKSATFTATILGWDPFAGRAAYSATATFSSETDTDPVKYGWTGYAQTASFSSILLGWDGLEDGGPYSGEATFTTSLDTEEGKIAAGFTEYSANPTFTLGDYTRDVLVYATLKGSYDGLGKTLADTEGFHTGYAKLNLNLQGTMTTSSGSPKQYYGYASLTPSLSGMYTNSYYPHTGYASLSAYLTVDPYYFNKEITDTQNEINTKMNSFSLNSSNITGKIQTLQDQINSAISGFSLNSPSSGGYADFSAAYSAGQSGWPREGYSWYSDTSVNTTSTSFRYASVANSKLGGYKPSIADMAYVLGQKAGASKLTGFSKYGVLVDTGSSTLLFAYADAQKSAAESNYKYWGETQGYRVEKYGFQKGGLVPGPMDTIPAMLAPGEYIMSQGAVNSLGVGTLNSLNAGDLSALRQTGDPEVRSLLRELIIAVKTSDTEVNVYTDMKGEAKAAIGEFRTELRERSRRQGEKYVNVRYV